MTFKQFSLSLVANVASLGWILHHPKPGLRILTFHSIGSSTDGDYLGLSTVSIKNFIQFMDIVASMQSVPLNGFDISQSELSISVTFDDGYADNLYLAAPFLADRKIPYTVFVATGFIKNKTKGFLTANELRQLSIAPGATIGAHGDKHINLTLCSKKKLKSEIEGSKKYLEDLLGRAVEEFAYPYGLADMRVRNAVLEAGYKLAACSRFDINKPNRDNLMLNRCVVLSSDTMRSFKQKIFGGYDWYSWRNKDPINIKGVK